MIWLSRLVAILLGALVSLMIISGVFGATFLNYHFLINEMNKTDSFSKLSDAIVNQIAGNSGSSVTPEEKAALTSVLSPGVLNQKISSTVSQVQAFYKSNGPTPIIDLSGLIAQARAQGLPVPSSNFDKPVVIKSNVQVKHAFNIFALANLASIIACIVLFLGLIYLCYYNKRFFILPDLMIVIGVFISVLGVIFFDIPAVVNHFAKNAFSKNDFAQIAHVLVNDMLKVVGIDFIIIGVSMLVIGIIVRIILGHVLKSPKKQPANKVSS